MTTKQKDNDTRTNAQSSGLESRTHKYHITEHATYEVEAENPKAALERFKAELTCTFPCDVDYRDVYDDDGNDVTEESEDE